VPGAGLQEGGGHGDGTQALIFLGTLSHGYNQGFEGSFADVRFAGVDLGWKTDPPIEGGTGVCLLDDTGAVLSLESITHDSEILSFLTSEEEMWVGVDAPLVVNNQRGLRECERSLFDHGIKVLPASRSYMLRRFGGCRGVSLSRVLIENGYRFGGEGEGKKALFEVYPHGTLHLLMGGKVPRHKKGGREERRRAALMVLRILREWVPIEIPRQLLLDIQEANDLKPVMDRVDSVVCVSCVYAHWLYSGKRTQLLGGRDGSMLLPRFEV